MAIETFGGEPGTTWTNDTEKIVWQFICQFANSCGRCIQFAGMIGPWWPLPLHRRCNCRNHPVMPGSPSKPFVDFQAEVERLDPAQQAVVMGRSNYALVQSGAIKWEDVVHKRRILNFREVVAKGDFGIDQLVRGGVTRGQAERAFVAVNAPEITAAAARRIEVVKILQEKGFKYDAIRDAVSRKLMARVGIAGGPSLSSGPLFGRGGTATGLAVIGLTTGFPEPTAEDRKPLTKQEQEAATKRVGDFLGLKPEPEAIEFGSAGVKVTPYGRWSEEDLLSRARSVLGKKDVTLEDLADLAGATSGSTVQALIGGSGASRWIELDVKSPDFSAVRRIHPPSADGDGKAEIENLSLEVKTQSQGKGIGLEVFGRQVETARRFPELGSISCEAARSGATYVGYKVWPKVGYDGELQPSAQRRLVAEGLLPDTGKTPQRLSDLYRDPAGRAWWEEHGTSIGVVFDLSEGSYSRTVWSKYLKNRAERENERKP